MSTEPNERYVERIFREHNESLILFLRTRLKSDADAAEAAQEAYVRLLALDEPERPSFVRAYLFKIAHNVALDMLRRQRVRHNYDEASDDLEEPTQERSLAARQQLVLAEQALTSLPPRCREAFVLSRHQGWATTQIADHLGVSDRMVRHYLIRAIEHLQHVLNEKSQ